MKNRTDIHSYGSLSYPKDMQAIIRNGLSHTTNPKNVIIIGAGMAGLVAASVLQQAGHNVKILEGNDRIGGRIYTMRHPFSKGLYLDMGAMRFPDTHKLVYEYILKFRLPTNIFYNKNDFYHINGVKTTNDYYEANPDVLNFPLPLKEQGKTAIELFSDAVKPFLDLYENATPHEQKRLRTKFDHYSFDDFLRFNPLGTSLSSAAIRKIKVMLGIEGFAELAFIDILLDIVRTVFNKDLTFYEITGGNDQLPNAFLSELSNLFYNQKVQRIIQDEEGVSVTTRDMKTNHYHTIHADYTIVTVPYTVFQFIEVYPHDSISFHKWKAVRELNYVSSVKIGLEFQTPFWASTNKGNIISDLPLRYTYGRSLNTGSGPSIMLASYSWGQNADLWNSLPEGKRTEEALQGLARIYGDQVYREFTRGASFHWGQNQFSAGCFTLFTPHQATDFSDHLYSPEGRLHFAGEHTSPFHGWVEGAIESAIRAAYEVNERTD
ncbi:flavin monoamine oxidase family protein [Alkalihalobacillus macyae]|uniref:flavin monoamine oxidase family protein n=1 Tax=Guptibacillus hwajinpoensis TaxID=208199 RepID=UPI00273AC412|nr:flavin monoamine oxidase family protein [Alkalihalobacillus macyae]MDP4552923.1 flavin monoamine oxidase family protein [Alkalihalobacillus macyae]